MGFGRNILLMCKKELLTFHRTRRSIVTILAIMSLGLFGLSFLTINPNASYDLFITNYTTTFIQLLVIPIMIFLFDAISGEKERGTWDFWMSKPLSYLHILLSKLLVSFFITVSLTIISWTFGITLFALIKGAISIDIKKLFFTFAIIVSEIFAILSIMIAVSSFFNRASLSALTSVILWLMLAIFNIVTPIGRGWLCPWALNSWHASIIARMYLNRSYYPFEKETSFPSLNDLLLAVFDLLSIGIAAVIIAALSLRLKTRN